MIENIVELLEPGERVLGLAPVVPGSPEATYGFTWGAIENSRFTRGNSVLFAVRREGATEPTVIVNDIELCIRGLRGFGYAVVYDMERDNGVVEVAELGASRPPLELRRGHAYQYVNAGIGTWVFRDDCAPAFQEGDEVPLTSSGLAVPADFQQAPARLRQLHRP